MELAHPHTGLAESCAIGAVDGLTSRIPLVAGHFQGVDLGTVEFSGEGADGVVAVVANLADDLRHGVVDRIVTLVAAIAQFREGFFVARLRGIDHRQHGFGLTTGHDYSPFETGAFRAETTRG